jgi:hypothetical protein
MSVQDQQEEEHEERAESAPGARSEAVDATVEFDERRNKMERMRAEGIDPYPPVSLWGSAPV